MPSNLNLPLALKKKNYALLVYTFSICNCTSEVPLLASVVGMDGGKQQKVKPEKIIAKVS